MSSSISSSLVEAGGDVTSTELVDNAAVIIRSVGERTESLCEHLLKHQVPADRIVVIHEEPFSAALKKSYEIGIDYGLDWTLCVDADLLLISGAISHLVTVAEGQPDSSFTFQGKMIDKFTGGLRQAGPHLYRSSWLGKALSQINDFDIVQRPETHVKRMMSSKGHPMFEDSTILAVHSYEQYYRDIYRTNVVRAAKSKRKVYREILDRSLLYSQYDRDFLVAAWAIKTGISTRYNEFDAYDFEDELGTLLEMNGFTEKGPLDVNGNLHFADTLVEQYLSASRRYNKSLVAAEQPPRIRTAISWYSSDLKKRFRRKLKHILSTT